MGDTMWWVVAVAVLVVAGWVGWRLTRRGRGAPAAEPPEAPVERTVPAPMPPAEPMAAPAARVAPPAAEPAGLPAPRPVPARAAAPTPAPSVQPSVPMPKTVAAEPVVERAPVRPALPRVPRFELLDARSEPVLVIDRADAAAWQQAAEFASTPVQRELLAGLLAQAPQLDGPSAADAAYRVRLRAAAALAVARGEIEGPALKAVPAGAIDTDAAADFAAALLALHAARRSLPELRAQVGETKSVAAALHPKLVAQTDGRGKTLMQDLGRYLREAEENYAGAIRKPVFIDRVGQACQQAGALWQGVQAQAGAARAALDVQARAPRFGEVQLERTVAALRELHGQRRLLDVAARLLSGWEQLHMLLGQRDAQVATRLGDTRRALDEGVAADLARVAALTTCLDQAKAPDYVGKAEFTTHLQAARELLAGIAKDTMTGAATSLDRAAAELSAPAVDEPPLALLLQLDAQGHVVAVREPVTSPAER